MVVGIKARLLFCLLTVTACRENLHSNNGASHSFIPEKYQDVAPLAEIKNLPIYGHGEKDFTIHKETEVQIYAVGEMDIALASTLREYYFKSDDIELFFGEVKDHPNSIKFPAFVYTWLDGSQHDNEISFIKDEVAYHSIYDTDHRCYRILLKMPWKKLPSVNDNKLFFDIAIGDNDDGMKQKGKICWHNDQDPLRKAPSFGTIQLINRKDMPPTQDGIIYSVKTATNKKDTLEDNALPLTKISNVVAGTIKNQSDLSAHLQSYWNDSYLCFIITVFDDRKGFAFPEIVKRSKTFHDYGWIEDEQGHPVWEMHALNSQHAGGAYKNQQVDTCIRLKPGNYTLKYITDESHSWDNWDDRAPETPFYGIVLYQGDIKK